MGSLSHTLFTLTSMVVGVGVGVVVSFQVFVTVVPL